MVSNNRDIIEFVGTTPFLRFALQVAMATMHFTKPKHVYLLRTFFIVFRGPKVQFGTLRNCPKGKRKAKLDDIRSIGHF